MQSPKPNRWSKSRTRRRRPFEVTENVRLRVSGPAIARLGPRPWSPGTAGMPRAPAGKSRPAWRGPN